MELVTKKKKIVMELFVYSPTTIGVI